MMKLATVAVLASIAFSTGQAKAAASPEFDLACEGARGMQMHFRFDLAQKKWCTGQCQSVWSIDELSDSRIKLMTVSSDSKYNWTFVIDRYTSNFFAIHRGYGDDPADQGKCNAQPFSGFPNRRF